MKFLPPGILGGLELMSACAFGIIVLVGIVVAALAVSVHLNKRKDETDEVERRQPDKGRSDTEF